MQFVQMACGQQQFASSPLQLGILRAGKSDRPQIFHRNQYNLLRKLTGEIIGFEGFVINSYKI